MADLNLTAAIDPELIERLRLAASDPGAIVGRRLHPSWGEGNEGYAEEPEYVSEWIGRALTVVLGEVLAEHREQIAADLSERHEALAALLCLVSEEDTARSVGGRVPNRRHWETCSDIIRDGYREDAKRILAFVTAIARGSRLSDSGEAGNG